MTNTLNKIIIFGLLAVILVLVLVLIYRKPDKEIVVKPFDDTKLREQIEIEKENALLWEEKANHWKNFSMETLQKVDSLQNLKPEIKKHYDKIYSHIDTANIHELDSILRANW